MKLIKSSNNLVNIFVLLLVISLFLSFPAKNNDKLAYTNLEKVIHEGDLIIQGNDEYLIEGKEFNMSDGDVYIYDNGKLIIKDSIFTFFTEYHAERKWIIRNNGRVEIINSEIHTPNKSGTIPENEVVTTFHDNSSLYINNSIVNGLEIINMNNSYTYINKSNLTDNLYPIGEWYEPIAGETAEIEVYDSDIHILGLTFPSGSETSLQDLKNGLMDFFELSGVGLGYHITLRNTNIFSLGLAVEMNAKLTIQDSKFGGIYLKNSSELKIYNSELDGIGILLRMSDPTQTVWIHNIEAGYFNHFDFNNYASGHNFTLILENTRINSWMINPHGPNLILENSKDIILRPWGWGTYVNVEVNHCHLLEQDFDTFFGMIIYKNSIIDRWSFTWDCNFDFKGNVEIIDASDIISQENGPCRNVIIRREFPVKTVPRLELEVYDSEDNLLWQGFTDENGEAYFTLNFDCSNYENEYLLRCKELGKERTFKLGSSTPLTFELKGEDLLGTWTSQGVYYRNSDTGKWVRVASSSAQVTAGDMDDDGADDLIGLWPLQGGVWIKYSSTNSWVRVASPASFISAGDMNGDGRDDLLGTWSGQGVFYRDSVSGGWVKMAPVATEVAPGDLDNDGIDDLIGIWPSQGGVWVKYSSSSSWARLSSTADWIGCGDMNGDGRDDLVGTWSTQGVFYKDSATGTWTKMATPATQVTAGDIDGDGTDDLLGIWPSQGGVWVKYSSSSTWQKLSSTAAWIACGKMRSAGSSSLEATRLSASIGGYAEGPGNLADYEDLSAEGPGGWNFEFQEEKNLMPHKKEIKMKRIPSPGEAGFACVEQENLAPNEGLIKKETRKSNEKRE